jgi:hypothetical protein
MGVYPGPGTFKPSLPLLVRACTSVWDKGELPPPMKRSPTPPMEGLGCAVRAILWSLYSADEPDAFLHSAGDLTPDPLPKERTVSECVDS